MNYSISPEKSKLNIDVIYDFLCNRSYWAKGRSLEDVKKTIEHSICFGLYDNREQMLGFARVVTDQVAFAYLMDVFILEEHRGKGLGKMLVSHIIERPELKIKFWFLGTVEAHRFYKKLGFSKLKHPNWFLEIKDNSPR